MTTWLTLEQVGGCKRFYKGSRGNLQTTSSGSRQLRHRRQIGIEPIGRRAIGILSILQALTIGEFFLRVRTSFGCLEKKLQPTDGRCEQYTHKYSTCRVASREHAWLKSPSNSCHPRVMSHPLPHQTLTTSTSSLSLTSPIFATTSPTHARPSVHDPYSGKIMVETPGDTVEQSIRCRATACLSLFFLCSGGRQFFAFSF